MVSGLKQDPGTNSPIFLRYVLAACSPKILSRLTDIKYSKPLMGYLNDISSFQFIDAYPKNLMDALLWNHIPGLATSLFRGQIPRLYELCRTTCPDAPRRLYTPDTCTEFHWLLCRLLTLFEEYLIKLSSPQVSSTFSDDLRSAALVGNALWSLSRSGAFESHMRAIEPQLRKLIIRDRCGDPDYGDGGGHEGNADGGGDEDDGSDGGDIDLRGVQPFTHQNDKAIPLWRSYRDWLVLMVAHLDAIKIIRSFVTRQSFPFEDVLIEVVTPPLVSKALLPWEKLLESTHFPADTSGPSTDDILMYFRALVLKIKAIKRSKGVWNNLLEKDLTSRLVNDTANPLWKRGSSEKDSSLRSAQNTIRPLQTEELREDRDIADIIEMVDVLVHAPKSEVPMMVNKITEKFNDIYEVLSTDKLLGMLIRTESGTCFGGTEHCEARLGTLITFNQGPAPTSASLPVRCLVFILL